MWKNLAPNLLRQRVIIEGTTEKIVKPDKIKAYLFALSKVAKMKVLDDPFICTTHEMGYAGYIHWTTSGTHFYSYHTNPPLFTVDIYTCKGFSVKNTIDSTKGFLAPIKLVWKEIKV